jgi:hypothetical protein
MMELIATACPRLLAIVLLAIPALPVEFFNSKVELNHSDFFILIHLVTPERQKPEASFETSINDKKAFLQCPTLEALNSEVEDLFTTFRLMRRMDLGTENEARVLGLYVYLRLPGQVLHPPGSHTCRKSSFSVFHPQGSKDSALAVKFFEKLKPAVTNF